MDKTALYQYEKQTGGTETQTITYKTAKVTKNNTGYSVAETIVGSLVCYCGECECEFEMVVKKSFLTLF